MCPQYNSEMDILGVTNYFLVEFEACPGEEIRAWYYKPGQKPMTRGIMGPRRDLNVFVLLNDCQITF